MQSKREHLSQANRWENQRNIHSNNYVLIIVVLVTVWWIDSKIGEWMVRWDTTPFFLLFNGIKKIKKATKHEHKIWALLHFKIMFGFSQLPLLWVLHINIRLILCLLVVWFFVVRSINAPLSQCLNWYQCSCTLTSQRKQRTEPGKRCSLQQ